MAIVPINGKFEGWRPLLAHIMDDDSVEHLVIATFCSDGAMKIAHFEATREQLAYAALVIGREAIQQQEY